MQLDVGDRNEIFGSMDVGDCWVSDEADCKEFYYIYESSSEIKKAVVRHCPEKVSLKEILPSDNLRSFRRATTPEIQEAFRDVYNFYRPIEEQV